MNLKEKLQSLLASANETTGESDTDLTGAISSLIDGYGGSSVVVNPLSVAQNGTYTAPQGSAYSPVVVNVPTEEPIPASVSGFTEFDIFVSKNTGKTIPCNMVGEKDWGDGTIDSLTEHTYEDYGYYTIVCKGTIIPSGSSSTGGGIFTSLTGNTNGVICIAARIGTNVTTIGQYAFYYCRAIQYIHIPDSVTTIGQVAFRGCYALERVRMTSSITNFTSFASGFYQCYTLARVDNIRINIFGVSMFQNCYALKKITLVNITNVPANTFATCYSLTELDFTDVSSVPTLANVSGLNGINGSCRIIVPDSLYDEWIAATNWSTYADYIYKESEV